MPVVRLSSVVQSGTRKQIIHALGVDYGTVYLITLVDATTGTIIKVPGEETINALDEIKEKDPELYRRVVKTAAKTLAKIILEYATASKANAIALEYTGKYNPRSPTFKNIGYYTTLYLRSSTTKAMITVVSEERTSIIDALSLEPFDTPNPRGKRKKTKFRRANGERIDADVNAALNMIRKAYGDTAILDFPGARIKYISLQFTQYTTV